MHRITPSRRRMAALITALLVLGAAAAAVWASYRMDVPPPLAEAARPQLLAVDDLAAAAEARAALASLRSSLEGQRPDRNGAQARRVAGQLQLAATDARRARWATWDAFALGLSDLRSQLLTTDPQALVTIAELEESLRDFEP